MLIKEGILKLQRAWEGLDRAKQSSDELMIKFYNGGFHLQAVYFLNSKVWLRSL